MRADSSHRRHRRADHLRRTTMTALHSRQQAAVSCVAATRVSGSRRNAQDDLRDLIEKSCLQPQQAEALPVPDRQCTTPSSLLTAPAARDGGHVVVGPEAVATAVGSLEQRQSLTPMRVLSAREQRREATPTAQHAPAGVCAQHPSQLCETRVPHQASIVTATGISAGTTVAGPMEAASWVDGDLPGSFGTCQGDPLRTPSPRATELGEPGGWRCDVRLSRRSAYNTHGSQPVSQSECNTREGRGSP